jgi:hypothetical protein
LRVEETKERRGRATRPLRVSTGPGPQDRTASQAPTEVWLAGPDRQRHLQESGCDDLSNMIPVPFPFPVPLPVPFPVPFPFPGPVTGRQVAGAPHRTAPVVLDAG